ncbi:hypothetical protein C6P42_003250 [Pichia californica]|nr:hypothetical protein C6P42_003250 [[Candida] californica]
MNSVNKNTSIATLNKQYFTINYFFNTYDLEINHSNQVTIKASATKNVIATFKYEDLVSIIIPKLICAAQSVDFFATSMKWGIAPTGINGPIFIDTVNSYSASMIKDIKTIVAASISAKVSYSVDSLMDEVDTFNIDLLFDAEEEDEASAALFKWLSHLDKPISWMESTDAFDIDLMFIKDVEEHKYDYYDLAWLFAPAEIQIDTSSWIDTTKSFDIECMFALDEEEHTYDKCNLTWLFAPDISASDEIEEDEEFADCDLSWLFATSTITEVETYDDCDLSWLFPAEEEIDDYKDCDLSWLFSTKNITSWMDEVDDFGLKLLFHLEFEIPRIVKLCDYLPETEVLIECNNLEDVISETASENGITTEEVPTPELSGDNITEEDEGEYKEYEADVDLLKLTVVKHKASLTILTPISEAINEKDDEEEDEKTYQVFKFITNNNIRTTKWLVLL